MQSPKTLGGETTNAVQAAIKFERGDFSLVYKFDYTSSAQSAPGAGFLTFGPLSGGFVEMIFASQPGGGPPSAPTRPDAVNNWFSTPVGLKALGHTATATYQVNENLTLKNIFGYRTNKTISTNQIDGSGGLRVTPSLNFLCGGPACDGQPLLLLGISSASNYRQLSNETQLSYTGRIFDLISGFYYFNDRLLASGMGIAQTHALETAPGFIMSGPSFADNIFRSNSKGLYAQATLHLLEKVDVVGGVRETWDHKRSVEPGFNSSYRHGDKRATWLANLSYRPNPETNLYLKAGTGYISGGNLSGVTYRPETATNFEGGLKMDLLDRRLRINTALFYAKYHDLQFPTFLNGITVENNAGTARTWGAELETTFLPVEQLTLQLNGGYTHFKYTELDPLVGNVQTYLPIYRPKWTGQLSAEYRFPTFAFGGELSARIDGQYHSSYVANPTPATPAEMLLSTSPAYWLLNGRLALANIPMSSAKGQVALWARNITDRKDMTVSTALGLVDSALYEPARTFGVDFSVQF